jgi:hypothetical protein
MPPILGREPSPPDARDYSIRALVPAIEAIEIPSRYMNRTLQRNLKARFDQQESSCVGQSLALVKIVHERRDARRHYAVDPLWIWRRSKQLDGAGSPDSDRGTYIRTALEVLRNEGAKVGAQETIDDELAADGRFKIDSYYRLHSIDEVKAALYLFGPVELGIDWPRSWFTPSPQGDMPPADVMAGGHAIVGYGYDDRRPTAHGPGAIRCANSWGTAWGDRGDFWLPYRYLFDDVLDNEAWKSIDVTTGKV